MKIEITERYAKDHPTVIPVLLLQPENEAEKCQIQSLSDDLRDAEVVNYDEADKPYRSTQVTIPLIHK